MGVYVNPSDTSKENWLETNGTNVGSEAPTPNGSLIPVCLVNNGPFTAAGVCYDERELSAFNEPSDVRPKIWYLVEQEKLITICPDLVSRIK